MTRKQNIMAVNVQLAKNEKLKRIQQHHNNNLLNSAESMQNSTLGPGGAIEGIFGDSLHIQF